MSYLILAVIVLWMLRGGARRVRQAQARRRSKADRHTYEVTMEDLNRGEAKRRGFSVIEGGKERDQPPS